MGLQPYRGVRVNPKETPQQTKTPNRTRCVGCGVTFGLTRTPRRVEYRVTTLLSNNVLPLHYYHFGAIKLPLNFLQTAVEHEERRGRAAADDNEEEGKSMCNCSCCREAAAVTVVAVGMVRRSRL